MKCYDYYYTKQLTAICFSKNPNQYFNQTHFTHAYLEFLYQKIVLNDITMINEQMKYNLLDLVNYIRFNKKITEEQIVKLNEIIISINSSEISFYPYQVYLAEEFDLRKPEGKAELNFLDDSQIEELLFAIEFDFTVLNSLLCDEKEYNDFIFSDLMLNEYYFGSINKLMAEIPLLIDKEIVRIMEVVLINKEYNKRKNKKNILNYDSEKLKSIIKEGNKLIKKMKY